MQTLQIHPEVLEALSNGRPIVALESAVITHGLPRAPAILPRSLSIDQWRSDQPTNLELARAMSRCVRATGAVPAISAIIEGRLHLGLEDDQLITLAQQESAKKAASHNLAMILATGQTAGTTVSATLTACALASSTDRSDGNRSKPIGIRVFATGGIGGVHRNWQQLPDISSDLRALASTRVCVVSSGAKSILDLPATLEALETLGIPVIGYQTNGFPQFQCGPSETLRIAQRVDDPKVIARICDVHWNAIGANSGILLANPVPQEFALNSSEYERIVKEVETAASARGIAGAARTPFLLEQIAVRTDNKSLYANLALLISNAKLAARIACELAQ